MNKELLVSTHETLPTPVLSVRAHHLLGYSMSYALFGMDSPEAQVTYQMSAFSKERTKKGDVNGYWEDLLGKGKRNWEEVLDSRIRYFQAVYELPDAAFLQVDKEPDGICNSCPIGKHCASMNYEGNRHNIKYKDGDTLLLEKIRDSLFANGFKLGEDFTLIPKTHTFFDLHGRSLRSPKPGTPIVQEYEAILVKKGVLKTILGKEEIASLVKT